MDGISALGGNLYANSPVSGNAEDFLTQDLVGYVDTTYRTIPEASARGLSAFSMGGSGTINVGPAHPDVYASLYAHSPGLLHEDGGLAGFLQSNGNWPAYGATFVPDIDAEYPHYRPIDAHSPLAGQDPDLLAENDIPNSEFVFEGGHGVNYFFFQQDCVDYFSRTLTA